MKNLIIFFHIFLLSDSKRIFKFLDYESLQIFSTYRHNIYKLKICILYKNNNTVFKIRNSKKFIVDFLNWHKYEKYEEDILIYNIK